VERRLDDSIAAGKNHRRLSEERDVATKLKGQRTNDTTGVRKAAKHKTTTTTHTILLRPPAPVLASTLRLADERRLGRVARSVHPFADAVDLDAVATSGGATP